MLQALVYLDPSLPPYRCEVATTDWTLTDLHGSCPGRLGGQLCMASRVGKVGDFTLIVV